MKTLVNKKEKKHIPRELLIGPLSWAVQPVIHVVVEAAVVEVVEVAMLMLRWQS